MQQMPMAPAEAANGGIWAFLACVLLPDISRWRFSGTGGGPHRLSDLCQDAGMSFSAFGGARFTLPQGQPKPHRFLNYYALLVKMSWSN